MEEDRNGDGRPDVWVTFAQGKRVSQAEDPGFTGRATVLDHFENDELVRTEERTTSDGPPELVTHYAHGQITRKEHDTKRAGRFDLISYFEDGSLRGRRRRRSVGTVRTCGCTTRTASGSARTRIWTATGRRHPLLLRERLRPPARAEVGDHRFRRRHQRDGTQRAGVSAQIGCAHAGWQTHHTGASSQPGRTPPPSGADGMKPREMISGGAVSRNGVSGSLT